MQHTFLLAEGRVGVLFRGLQGPAVSLLIEKLKILLSTQNTDYKLSLTGIFMSKYPFHVMHEMNSLK